MNYKSIALTAKAAGEDGRFSGYGSVFGVVDSWGDRVTPGAFATSLADWHKKGRMPKLLWQHDPAQPVGVWETIVEDGRGLKMQGRLLIDDVPKAREVHALLKAGAVDGLSIGYQIKERTWNEDQRVHELSAVELLETSIVTFPANDAAVVDTVKTARADRVAQDITAARAILHTLNGDY